jgi:hypothetical protein
MNKTQIIAELVEILDLAEQTENIYLYHKTEKIITSLRDTWDRDDWYFQEICKDLT